MTFQTIIETIQVDFPHLRANQLQRELMEIYRDFCSYTKILEKKLNLLADPITSEDDIPIVDENDEEIVASWGSGSTFLVPTGCIAVREVRFKDIYGNILKDASNTIRWYEEQGYIYFTDRCGTLVTSLSPKITNLELVYVAYPADFVLLTRELEIPPELHSAIPAKRLIREFAKVQNRFMLEYYQGEYNRKERLALILASRSRTVGDTSVRLTEFTQI